MCLELSSGGAGFEEHRRNPCAIRICNSAPLRMGPLPPCVWIHKVYGHMRVLQADVFSFGIMMYEVLQRYIMLSAVAVRGTYEELEAYCARVADGYRPPLHSKWPAAVSKLIQVTH